MGPDGALSRIIEGGIIPNMIFYGPSGVGKTTVARIIAERAGKKLHKLNGTNAGIADIKAVVDDLSTISGYKGVVLYLDEIQYLNKKQQQSLLEYIEDGRITLIASTTENPYFYIYGAVLCAAAPSSSLRRSSRLEVEKAVRRGFAAMEEELGVPVEVPSEDGVAHIARSLRRGCAEGA